MPKKYSNSWLVNLTNIFLESCRQTEIGSGPDRFRFNDTLPRLRAYSNEKCDNGAFFWKFFETNFFTYKH